VNLSSHKRYRDSSFGTLFLFFVLAVLDLKSGPHSCEAGVLPLELRP
jgi:hypothetical protein